MRPDNEPAQHLVAELTSRQLLDARAGADLAALSVLEAKIARAVQASRAPATLKAYRTDWADFTLWCETHGLGSMPAAPAAVAGYVADLAEPADDRRPRAASTIQRRLAAIGEAHKLRGPPQPVPRPARQTGRQRHPQADRRRTHPPQSRPLHRRHHRHRHHHRRHTHHRHPRQSADLAGVRDGDATFRTGGADRG